MWLFVLKVILWFRCLRAKRVERFSEAATTDFHVMPWDLDENKHMNNSRYLCYFEAARYALVFRSNFFKALVKNQWGTPIGSYRVQYYRSLKAFTSFRVSAQIIFWDDRSLVFEHKVFSKHPKTGEFKLMARALMRQFVRSGRTMISPAALIAAIGLPAEASPPATEELVLWEKLDAIRPTV